MPAELLEAAGRLEAPAARRVVRAAGQQDVPGPDARTLALRVVELVRGRDEDERVHALLVTLTTR